MEATNRRADPYRKDGSSKSLSASNDRKFRELRHSLKNPCRSPTSNEIVESSLLYPTNKSNQWSQRSALTRATLDLKLVVPFLLDWPPLKIALLALQTATAFRCASWKGRRGVILAQRYSIQVSLFHSHLDHNPRRGFSVASVFVHINLPGNGN